MTDRRNEILRATIEASSVLQNYPIGARSSFDIVGAVISRDIPLVFRPLKGLLGATITVGDDAKGVLITTTRDLSVQRFTLAHELGHILLGHEMSLDKEIDVMGRFGAESLSVEEIAANTFASEILAPRSLMIAAAKRHKWTKEAMGNPANVYQLALRLGISFQAVCWALYGQRTINRLVVQRLRDQVVKTLKLAVVPEEHLPNAWANAWDLTGEDADSIIEAGPEDVFAISLKDNSSSGYLWELVDSGSARILDEHANVGRVYGGASARKLLLRFDTAGLHRLTFEHRRPWNNHKLAHIDIQVQNYGKEQGGFARRVRESSLAAVGA